MLNEILATSRQRAAALEPTMADLMAAARSVPSARGFAAALTEPGLSVVAEIKRKSPSAGSLAPQLDSNEQARRYFDGGAAALSILTEPDFFAGSLDDLVEARKSVELPALRKDFTVAPVQVWEARACGADAVLLIVSALDDDSLRSLIDTAREAGLDALVEVHDELEIERAFAAEATLIGVNNRDLGTFASDPAVSERLAPMLASVPVTVAESGITDVSVAARMANAGFDAILVGEALVVHPDPASLVTKMRGVR